ncbi:hypothetical protein SARC_03078 [Sphaeroforma arctica JP610]|uniref:SH3 domain-containing protein n=1 Tax=Sphaeroforma arctica JP610 TaxID=667725 RepID=A0A0L0G8Y5_9EUKA|nr:hypothetical protein SARC_03078 [Sphaeroforma arctica JP610]KNC84703.1 hypothetical protein SARC_03078 [Sphaeroforma arctica JP610]|eukprot:XP_014158605.1 hypothetical protein SARC_03078 [Sphaeroforma arctica JP610]
MFENKDTSSSAAPNAPKKPTGGATWKKPTPSGPKPAPMGTGVSWNAPASAPKVMAKPVAVPKPVARSPSPELAHKNTAPVKGNVNKFASIFNKGGSPAGKDDNTFAHKSESEPKVAPRPKPAAREPAPAPEPEPESEDEPEPEEAKVEDPEPEPVKEQKKAAATPPEKPDSVDDKDWSDEEDTKPAAAPQHHEPERPVESTKPTRSVLAAASMFDKGGPAPAPAPVGHKQPAKTHSPVHQKSHSPVRQAKKQSPPPVKKASPPPARKEEKIDDKPKAGSIAAKKASVEAALSKQPTGPKETNKQQDEPEAPQLPGRDRDKENGPRAKAEFDFEGDGTEGELSFTAGETIYLTEKINEDWYQGEMANGTYGMFPSNFVKVIRDIGEPEPEPKKVEKKASTRRALPSTAGKEMTPPPPKGPHAIALFDFKGEDSDELSFFEGEEIKLLEKVSDEWFQGEGADGSQGIFPANFVKVVVEIGSGPVLKRQNSNKRPSSRPVSKVEAETSKEMARALFDYDANDSDDLPFKEGDMIEVLEHVDADWLTGTLNGNTGMFPLNFVEIVKTKGTVKKINSKPKQKKETRPHAIALFDYEGDTPDDLSFTEGDTIILTAFIDEDWFEGENEKTNDSGMFPANFVEVKINL